MQVKIIRIDKSLPLPEYHTEGAVAFDLYTRVDSSLVVGEFKLLPANLIVEVPEGFFLMITSRSSIFRKGLQVALGVIDQDYHGPKDELLLSVRNVSEQVITIKAGDRLAQGVIIPIERAEWLEVDKIKDESRGGFGSTGK